MKPYDQLTIVRNRSRVSDLRSFRGLVRAYYERSRYDDDGLPMDWEGAQAARADINRMLPRIVQVVEAARIGTSGIAGEPGIAVGRVGALQHIFTDRHVDSGGQEILDVLDMTIGVYEATWFDALVRTVNPFFYVGRMLVYVLGLPKRFFQALGFGRSSYATLKQAEEVKRLDAVATRLSDAEELVEMRLAEFRDRLVPDMSDHGQQLTELAERLDFTERVLAQQRAMPALGAGHADHPLDRDAKAPD